MMYRAPIGANKDMQRKHSNFQQLKRTAVECRAGGKGVALLPSWQAGREELAGQQQEPIPSPFNLQRAFHFPANIDNYPCAIFFFWKHRK